MVATFITTNPPEISPKTQSTNPRKLGREENFESEAKKSKLIENVHENENMEVDEEINRRVKKISITPSETDDDEAMLVAAEILEAAKLKTSSTLSSTSTNGTPNSNGTSNRLDKPILESQKRQFLEWMRENGNNLYPSRQDKEMLAVHLKASYIQVTRLLANHRRRQLKYKRLKGSTDSSPQENKENSLNLEEPTEEMQIPQSPSNLSIHSNNSSIYQTPMNSRKRSHLPSTDIEAERERKIDETIMDIWNKVTSGKNEENTSKNPSESNSKEAHGFATPPPSVLPTAQNTPIDSHTNGQTQQFLTPTSTSSLFGCQQVPELNHTRAVHSPAITPPEHAASMDAKLLAAAVSSSTNGTTHTTSQQTAAVNAFHQTLAAAAASGQINGGNTPSAVSAALALNQLLSTPAGAAAMAQNPMLLAAMSALNNGANWQHPSVLPALLAILHQNYDPQGFAAIQTALIQEAQQAQHRQLLAQLTQHQLAAAAVAAMSQDQISLEKAAAALHNSGDPRLISHPQWMSPPLSSNTPASSSSPLIFSGDELSNTGATAGTSNVPSSGSSGLEENSSPAPRGDVFSPHRGHHHSTSSFDSLADYNRWDCDDVQQFLTEQSILSEKESIAVAVLAGFSSIR